MRYPVCSIKVKTLETWSWKCSACGEHNTQPHVRIDDFSGGSPFSWDELRAGDKCLEKTNKGLSELEYQYLYLSPKERNYRLLSLPLKCNRCGHRECWACPSAITGFIDTKENIARIQATDIECLPKLVDYKFEPIPAEERRKKKNKYMLIFIAVIVVLLLLCNLSQ